MLLTGYIFDSAKKSSALFHTAICAEASQISPYMARKSPSRFFRANSYVTLRNEDYMIDKAKIEQAVRMILEAVNEDPDREGLLETPSRVARMYEEVLSGMNEDASIHLGKQFSVEDNNLVLEKDISFYSMCEHHMLPFFGKVHIAYIPDGRVVGLSKLARTVEVFAKRLQIQEKMTVQIADALVESLSPLGAMVVIEAEHTCMTMRGVKKPGSKTVTVVTRGRFSEDCELRKTVLDLIKE